MNGATIASDIQIHRMEAGRMLRDAVLNIANPAIVSEDEKVFLSDLAKMHADLDTADKSFYSKEGVEVITQIRQAFPAYEKSSHDCLDRIRAKDASGGLNILNNVLPGVAQPLNDGADKALAIKRARAEEKFQDNAASYSSARTLMTSASVLSLVMGLMLSFVIARGFSVPLGKAVEALEKIAGGDLTTSLDVYTRDEVGRMASALNDAVAKLNSTMQEVADSAANASSSSQQLASASEAIASGAQEQAASLEETSASLEEITATVRQSADNAQQASQLAAGSKDSALQGQEVVEKAIAAMTEINVASAKISDIISTIDEIAFQTNLLAVNAAVEAARAGEEGRGFAVVASEVRSLAQRSAVAAKEIKVLIQDSMRKVDAGSTLVNRSGETLQGIVGSVKRVTDIVGEIAAASGEQSAGIDQVNTAITQMDQVTQSNSAQTEELSATAESLSEQAAHLLELVSAFTLSSANKQRGRQESQASRSQHSNSVALSPSKMSQNAAFAKSTLSKRKGTKAKSLLPALSVAVPSGSSGDDASFQEF
jgi:methyl-accepting chemotaxis protein